MPTKLAAGNWKMNGTRAQLAELRDLTAAINGVKGVETVICPPAHLLMPAMEVVGSGPVQIGAQDCHSDASGAFTGDISAPMIAECGGRFVIVGHSERRSVYGETDARVRAKAQAAQAAGLAPIICIGESEAERDRGDTLDVLKQQLDGSCPDTTQGLVVAYEPIWAIGTGRVATLEQIDEVHTALRRQLTARFGDAGARISLLYGGSVKADNAVDIFTTPHVNGALVGGASLKAVDFAPIVKALAAA